MPASKHPRLEVHRVLRYPSIVYARLPTEEGGLWGEGLKHRPAHGTREWRLHQFLSNPDPMALLRMEIRATRAAVYHQHPCNPSRGAMSYTMTWEGHYVRVAWVDKRHPQLRAIGEVTVQPEGGRVFMKDIPLPVRHVLAGWIHMMYHRLSDERVTWEEAQQLDLLGTMTVMDAPHSLPLGS